MVSTRTAARSNAASAGSNEPEAPSNDARSSSCAREAAACCSLFVGLGEGAAFADDRTEGQIRGGGGGSIIVVSGAARLRARSPALRW